MSLIEEVQKTIESVCYEICSNYCKWPEQFDEDKEGCELAESDHCMNCPLNKLQ